MSPDIFDVYSAPLAGHTLIEASAGTGKTWTLSGLYARLLLDAELNLQVGEILVVTFTTAATGELRDRIRKRLADVLESFRTGVGSDEFCERLLAGFSGEREWAVRKLTRAVAGFDDASVFTIHGFCQRVLADAAFESGADFGLSLLTDQSELLIEVAEDYWRRQVYPAQGPWLDFLQLQEAAPEGWLGLLKEWLGHSQRQLLPLPPVPELAAVLARFEAGLAALAPLWRVHRKQVGEALASDPGLNRKSYDSKSLGSRLQAVDTLIERDQVGRALFGGGKAREPLIRFSADRVAAAAKKGFAPLTHPFFDAVGELIRLADELLPVFRLRLRHLLAGLWQYLRQELPRRKQERQQISFDDLLEQVWQATHGPQREQVCAAIRARYRAALVDEFQDTDPVQCGIFQAVYAGSGLPLFFVGDPKQAIYRFRGADIHAYLAARRNVDRTATLDTNQRSIPPLIRAVNALFGNGRRPGAFVDAGIAFQPVRAADRPLPALYLADEPPQALQFLLLPAQMTDKGEKTLSLTAAGELAAAGTANEIARLLTMSAAGQAWIGEPQAHRPLGGGDIAVLVPGAWQARQIQAELRLRGIASVRQVRESVFASQEAHALLAVLQAIAMPTRQGWVRSALVSTLMGYDINTLQQMIDQGEPWESVLDQFGLWHQSWREGGFMRMLRHWLDWPGAQGRSVVQRLLARIDGERQLTNLLHLAELLQQQSRQRVGIEPLLIWLQRMLDDPDAAGDAALMRLESDADRVQIVTIHSSKGLEYPLVFCPWLFDGKLGGDDVAVGFHQDDQAWLDFGSRQFDSHRRLAARETLAEKVRLAYVALTRARYRCLVVWGNVGILAAPSGNDDAQAGLVRGLHGSALAWLLHPCPDQDAQADPLLAMRSHCAGLDSAAIGADLRRLQSAEPDAIGIRPLLLTDEPVMAVMAAEETPTRMPATFSRDALRWGWRVVSFSGLTREALPAAPSEQLEAADRDAVGAGASGNETDPRLRELDGYGFPLGEVPASVAGTTVHAILEQWNWDLPDALPAVVECELARAGLQPRWQPVVESMVRHTVATRLDRQALTLASVPAGRRLAEMEFTFPLRRLSVAAVQQWLQRPQSGVDPVFADASRQLGFDSLQGFMRGFIDLVFEAGGRYYIVDYKTNRLGDQPADYAPERLRQAMAHSHYYLQYLIYSVAVHRYLASRLPDYDFERHFGGVYYLFLRGMADESGHTGVFFDRPSAVLIDAFERQIMGAGS